MWRFADAHCDTILKVMEAPEAFRGDGGSVSPTGPEGMGRLHVTLEGLRAAGVCAQVFACFVLERRHPGRARERGFEVVEAVYALCSAYPENLVPADGPWRAGCQVVAAVASRDGRHFGAGRPSSSA